MDIPGWALVVRRKPFKGYYPASDDNRSSDGWRWWFNEISLKDIYPAKSDVRSSDG